MAKNYLPIRHPSDVQYDPPHIVNGLITFLRKSYRTEFWFTLCRRLEAIRRADGLFNRSELKQLMTRYVRTRQHLTLKSSFCLLDLQDWREAMSRAAKHSTDELDWVYCHLRYVPSVFKLDKKIDYADCKDKFRVHPPESEQSPQAPTDGAWGFLMWASRHEPSFYRMYQTHVQQKSGIEKERRTRDLRPEAEAKSQPRQMPKIMNKEEEEQTPGAMRIEELTRQMMNRS